LFFNIIGYPYKGNQKTLLSSISNKLNVIRLSFEKKTSEEKKDDLFPARAI
jgi:hypothetical protein